MSVAPSGLTAAYSGTPGSIDLDWTNNDTYDYLEIQYHDGTQWWVEIDDLAGSSESYSTSDYEYGYTYTFRVRHSGVNEQSDWSDTDTCALLSDTFTETIDLSGTLTNTLTVSTTFSEGILITGTETDIGTFYQTMTEKVDITSTLQGSQTIRTNYSYYLGSADGKVYQYSGDFYGDAGAAIPADWKSQRLDFVDIYPQYINRRKTVYGGRLMYVDKTASTNITVYVSADGGATWKHQTKTVGTGDGKIKEKMYHFILTGRQFNVKVENSSASGDFQWIALELMFKPSGAAFEVG